MTSNVTNTSACQYSTINNDSEAAVNSEAFFGHNDWVFDAKDDDLNGVNAGDNTFGLVLTGGNVSGSWDLTSLSSIPAGVEIMLVFKGGNANPSRVVAYLLTSVSGLYDSPFYNDVLGLSQKTISHVSLYVRGDVPEIPIPGAIWLMGAGLAGLGFSSRKKKAR